MHIDWLITKDLLRPTVDCLIYFTWLISNFFCIKCSLVEINMHFKDYVICIHSTRSIHFYSSVDLLIPVYLFFLFSNHLTNELSHLTLPISPYIFKLEFFLYIECQIWGTDQSCDKWENFPLTYIWDHSWVEFSCAYTHIPSQPNWWNTVSHFSITWS